jgi:GTP-binding protein YchF
MKIALCGTSRSGKTTLFEILTGSEASARSGRGRPEARLGVARVPDPRLERLTELYRPRKSTPATVQYEDLAPLEEGSCSDASLVAELRSADALLVVLRAWDDPSDPHPSGSVDPARDLDLLLTEFLLADLEVASRRAEKLESLASKPGRSEEKAELDRLLPLLRALEEGTPVGMLELSEAEEKAVRGFGFLTAKPVLIAVNLGEEDTGRIGAGAEAFGLAELVSRPGVELVALSARIEAEIADLPDEDAAAFRADLGLAEPALDRLLRASLHLLGQISFFTVGEDECRAWTVRRGSSARRAAGTIHTDLERGFIRAETVGHGALLETGSFAEARQRGLVRLEGKDYVVQDGDVMNVRFAV